MKETHTVIANSQLESPAQPNGSNLDPVWIATLRRQIETMRFGVVQVVVHDGRVVQIERTEKIRFDAKPN